MTKNKNTYFLLFLSTLHLSAFTFGGGFVIISLMKKKFVDELQWISEKEMLDFTAIAQSSPGAVAINASILLGYRVAGIGGALVAILGTILPPLAIISVISLFYTTFRDSKIVNAVLKGMQAGVAAVIVDVALRLGSNVVKAREWHSMAVIILAFTATFVLRINVMYIILACAAFGMVKMIIVQNKRKFGEE